MWIWGVGVLGFFLWAASREINGSLEKIASSLSSLDMTLRQLRLPPEMPSEKMKRFMESGMSWQEAYRASQDEYTEQNS